MKKTVSLLLAALLLFSMLSSTASAAIDISTARELGLDVDMNDDGTVFISYPNPLIPFEHKYSRSSDLSYFNTDIIVLDYFSLDSSPYLRFGISYNAEKYLGWTSVSIEMFGKEYTFTGLGGTDNMENYGTGIRETSFIIFGIDNLEFWTTFAINLEEMGNLDEIEALSFPMTLHGFEDVETEMPGEAIASLFCLLELYGRIAGWDTLVENDIDTAMTVKTIS